MSALLESYPIVSSRAGHFHGEQDLLMEKRTSSEERNMLRSPVPIRPFAGGLDIDKIYDEMRDSSMEILNILLTNDSMENYESISSTSSSDDGYEGFFFDDVEMDNSSKNGQEDDFMIQKNLSTSRLKFAFGNHSPSNVKTDSSYLLTIRPPTRSDNPLPYNESFYSSDNSDKEGAEIGLFSI